MFKMLLSQELAVNTGPTTAYPLASNPSAVNWTVSPRLVKEEPRRGNSVAVQAKPECA